jgi:DNA gyrase/topoisomerase IV subunit B
MAYQKLSLTDHILQTPELYINSPITTKGDAWIFKNGKNTLANIDINYGCVDIYRYILTNACEFCDKINPVKIKVVDNIISITNYCKENSHGLPVRLYLDGNEYVPEIIFGSCNVSSNYDQQRGIQNHAFLANVFSSHFQVCIYDAINKLSYVQEWTNNSKSKSAPIITDYDGIQSSVTVTFVLDPKIFNIYEYSNDMFGLFENMAINYSHGLNTPIIFNDTLHDYRNFNEYIKLFISNDTFKFLNSYEYVDATYKYSLYFWKSNSIINLSLVNCEICIKGRHFKAIKDNIFLMKPNDHNAISFFINMTVPNPIFSNRITPKLLSPVPKIDIQDDI